MVRMAQHDWDRAYQVARAKPDRHHERAILAVRGHLAADVSPLGIELMWWPLQLLRYTGDTTRALDAVAMWRAREGWDTLPPDLRQSWILIPTLAEGHPDSAASAFLAWYRTPLPGSAQTLTNHGLVEAATALDRMGRSDSAVVLYERALAMPSLDGGHYEGTWYPVVLRRLGELHASLRHREEAIDYYSQFIELWKDADPDLQPQVEAAREARARLLGEPLSGSPRRPSNDGSGRRLSQ
jgi:tetratricopeptide (TPR) repeat protein